MNGLMNERVSDFALIIGHIWRCTACREALLANPAAMWIGYKLNESQRECISKLGDADFGTMMRLAEVTRLSLKELDLAVDHPRARLRHLGSIKGDPRAGASW